MPPSTPVHNTLHSSPGVREPLSAAQRAEHLRWLHEITALPTASGKEGRVAEWVRRWARDRDDLVLTHDASENLHIAFRGGDAATPEHSAPLYFTAHMDHPAFLVEAVLGGGLLELSFRGGVNEEYFMHAGVLVHDATGRAHRAVIDGKADGNDGPFPRWFARFDGSSGVSVAKGDVATWDVGEPQIYDDLFYCPACDDLAALAAAVSAMDVLRTGPRLDVRLLLTRAEEIGFVGAIAAVKHKTMPDNARVVALENSRAFPESPIGGGPIVRVGDRLSIFSPSLTAAVAARAEQIAGGPASVTASQKSSALPSWRWQRKLMAGGACEASVFCDAGYESTCVCLPLGNYHNMADLDAVQAGTNQSPPRVAREYIAVRDFQGLVDLLIACGRSLPIHKVVGGMRTRLDRLWNEREFVLR